MKFSLLFAFLLCCTFSLHAQWERVLDANGSQINTLEHTPNGRLWAGTRNGLFQSDDDGATWTRNSTVAPTWNVQASKYINGTLYLLIAHSLGDSARILLHEIAANGSSSSKILGTSPYTEWTHAAIFSANNFLFVQADDILLRKPVGASNTWTTVQIPNFSLRTAAGDGNVLVVSGLILFSSEPLRALLSLDGGTTWKQATLPGAAATEGVIAVYVHGTQVLVSYSNSDLFVSNDQGNSWAKVKLPFSVSYLDVRLRWDETLDQLTVCLDNSLFYTSPDGGLTWQLTDYAPGNEVKDFVPEDQRLYIGGKAGFTKRSTPGGTFVKSNNGLRAAPTRFVKSYGNETFAVFNTSLYRSGDGGTTWSPINIPLLSAPDFSEIRGFEKSGNRLYLLTNKGLLMSEDNGATWPAAYNTTATGASLQFGAPGELWIKGNNGLVTVVSATNPAQVIRTYSYLLTPGTNDFLHTLHYNAWDGNILGFLPENGNIYASANKGKDWTIRANLPGTLNLAGRFYQAGGTNGRLFFLSGSNLIFYSDDHGFTWTKATGPTNIGAVTEMIETGGNLYATTYNNGILRSPNNGKNWTLVPNNVTDIHLEGIAATTVGGNPRLLVGSANRGVWRYDPSMTTSPFKLESGKTNVCPGAFMTYCMAALPFASKYTWLVPPTAGINGSLDNPVIQDGPAGRCADIYFGAITTGTNTISVTYEGDAWPVPVTTTFPVSIQPIATQLSTITIAYEDLPFNLPLTGDAVPPSPGNYNFATTLTSYLGCDSIIRQNVTVKAPVAGTVLGNVFWDNNNSGFFNSSTDTWASGILIRSSSGLLANTDASGQYVLKGLVVGDTIWAVPTVANTAVFPTFIVYKTGNWLANFRFFKTSSTPDLTIDITPQSVFRSGFDTKITVTCRNYGLQTAQNVQVKLYLPNFLTVNSTTPIFNNQIGDTLVWDLGALPFNVARNIMVTVTTPANIPLNTPVVLSATVSPVTGDANPSNNKAVENTWVRNAYDPNDKQVSPAYVTPAMLANKEQFSYTIRFQNTGNFPADFVRITDTLGSLVDPSTFRFIASSHPCTWKIAGKGIIEFFFENIQLPDSTSDLLGSHGFVKFSVQPKHGLQLGTVVKNTADIYFDFNPAVRTNTAGTQVVYFIPGQPPAGDELALRPNPAAFRAFCSWKNPLQESGIIRLYDLNGLPRREMQVAVGSTEAGFDVQGLPSGAYLAVLEAGPVFMVKTLTVVNMGWMGLGGQ